MPLLRYSPLLAALLFGSVVMGPGSADAEDDFGGLPPGPGQEETFYACGACHSVRLVIQQGLSRERWDETLVWMVQEQEMERLEPDERKLILDYLSTYITPEWHDQRIKNR